MFQTQNQTIYRLLTWLDQSHKTLTRPRFWPGPITSFLAPNPSFPSFSYFLTSYKFPPPFFHHFFSAFFPIISFYTFMQIAHKVLGTLLLFFHNFDIFICKLFIHLRLIPVQNLRWKSGWLSLWIPNRFIGYLKTKSPEKQIFAQEHHWNCNLKSWEGFVSTHIALPFFGPQGPP